MGIDYITQHDCEPKGALGVEGIMARLKARNQAQAIVDIMKQREPSKDPMQVTFTRMRHTPDGDIKQDCTVAQLLEETKVLDEHAPKCQGCPANCERRPFGCFGYINYPFPRSAEKWLMDRLPADLDSTAGGFLMKAIQDFEVDGEIVGQMRRDRQFFESNSPAVRKWGSFFKRTKVDSNQIMQFMFFFGEIDPARALVICLILGLIPHDAPAEDVMQLLAKPELLARKANLPEYDPDSEVAGVAGFLEALVAASSRGEKMDLDV
ncbi:MAG: hypothetical protein ABFD69_09345 [Candidatus Sumerlaeia bacterium]